MKLTSEVAGVNPDIPIPIPVMIHPNNFCYSNFMLFYFVINSFENIGVFINLKIK